MRKPLTVGSLIAGRTGSVPMQTAPLPVKAEAPKPQMASRPVARPQESTPVVRVRQNGRQFAVKAVPSQTLLSAALAQGANLAYKCQQGSCGKCTVQLLAGGTCLAAPTTQEQDRLGGKLVQGYRLACQSSFRSTIPK